MENCDHTDYLDLKFLSVLKELLKSDFNVSDDTILDKLYTHIENSKSLNDTLHKPEVGEWLETVLCKCTDKDICYGVRIFAVRLTGLIGSTIEGFNTFRSKVILDQLLKLISDPDVTKDSCLIVPLIHNVGKFINHEEGWKWVTETSIWRNTIKVLNEEKSIYVRRAGVLITSLLIIKSVIYDKNVGIEILIQLSEPLIRNKLLYVQAFTEYNAAHDIKNTCEYGCNIDTVTDIPNVIRSATYLCSVLEDIFTRGEVIPGKLCLQFQNTINTKEYLSMNHLLHDCLSSENHQHLSSLIIMVHISNAFGKHDGIATCPLTFFHSDVYWIIESLTSQGHFNALMNICVACVSGQFKVNHKRGNGKTTCESCSGFERSIVYCLVAFLHLHPNCFMGNNPSLDADTLNIDVIPNEKSTYSESLHTKLLKACQEDKEKTQKISIQYIQLGVFGISRCFNYFTNLTNKKYIFTNVVNTLNSILRLMTHRKDLVIPLLLNLIGLASKLIEDHLIPFWVASNDCSANIFGSIINMLLINNCDTRIITTTLQLLNKALRLHIVPDLLQSTDIPEIDVRERLRNLSILINKLSDSSWEIRDTTLEVYQTMIDMTGMLPWLFIDIFQADTINKILDLAQNDEYAYVRSSAFNFLTKAVRGDLFEPLFDKINLLELALKTLRHDDMPATRRAACDLITTLYIKSDTCLLENENDIFAAIYSTSINELDWEVKKAALNFWHCTINKSLTRSKIPLHLEVFSSLKYSSLSKEDITLLLMEVFGNLGDIGCLKAIWLGVNDECDLKVSQEAQKIVDHLEELDLQWKYIETILNCPNSEEMSDNISEPHKLNAKDFFTLIRNQDWRERLCSRQNWIENKSDDLISLLDHILNVDNNIGGWNHNSIDCY